MPDAFSAKATALARDTDTAIVGPPEQWAAVLTHLAPPLLNVAHEGRRDIARWAALAAGFPDSVPAATVNASCASSLTCTIQIAHAIRAGELTVDCSRTDTAELGREGQLRCCCQSAGTAPAGPGTGWSAG